MAESTLTNDFLSVVRRGMKGRRMSQRVLALRSGVDHSTLSRLLAGDREPTLRTAVALLDVLGYELAVASRETP